MIQFLNYNFLKDGNAVDPLPSAVNNIDTVKLQNAIYWDFLLTNDVESPYSTVPPTDWDIYTILLATFNNTLNAGSIDININDLDAIRIKRRKLGGFDWATLLEQPVSSTADLGFSGIDYFAQSDEIYEYAWVPIINGNEGNYIISDVLSKFQGVFICDFDTIYKFYAGVAYGPSQQTQQVGIYNPLGTKYPIYITNGANNYQTGSVTAKIMGNYETTHILNRKEMVEEKNALIKWLTNKKAKILKDSNGNIWLVFITGAPAITYNSQWGNNMMEISFQWGELGDADNIQDMQKVGLLPQIY